MKYTEKRVHLIFKKVKERLPSTYPHVKLVIYSSLKKLIEYYWKTSGTALDPGDPGHPPFAFCDGDDYSIHIASCLGYESALNISWYLLHEIGHLQALKKYGEKDLRWDDYKTAERYANSFADRWKLKIQEEGVLNKI